MATTHTTKSTRSTIKSTQYKRPLSISPWSKSEESKNGSVWISMKPKRIIDQYTKGAGEWHTEDIPVEFMFLAPLALNENIVHHWEAYESVSSRLAQKARSIIKLANEGRALYKVGENFLTEKNANKDLSAQKGSNEGSTIENWVSKIYNTVPGSKIPRIKVDTPMYYTNSDRRQIVFEFQLFNESIKGYSPDKILLEPIQELMKYSSPDLISEGGISIEFPYMWEVKTLPQQFIKYTTCALTGVQPTWNSPYVNGYPVSCNLQLTFVDLSPLYAGTIEYGDVINVKTSPSSITGMRNGTQTTSSNPAMKRSDRLH